MRVPTKQPSQTKAQLRHTFTSFSLLHDLVHTDYGHEINVTTAQSTRNVLLKRLAGAGADPHQASIIAMVGVRNEFLEMDEDERERLTNIATELANSDDFIMCHSDLVEALVEGPIEECKDAVAIAFHSYLFHECTWTVTAISGYEDSFDLAEERLFCLVRNVNAPTLQRFNNEIERTEGAGCFTLSTPLEENGTNPRDILTWRRYISTPWATVDDNDDGTVERGWTDNWPQISNNTPAYRMLVHRLDEMNNYKNRLRCEVERLTKKLLQDDIQDNAFAPVVEEQGRGITHRHMQILADEIG